MKNFKPKHRLFLCITLAFSCLFLSCEEEEVEAALDVTDILSSCCPNGGFSNSDTTNCYTSKAACESATGRDCARYPICN